MPTPDATDTQRTIRYIKLAPRGGQIWAVRWIRGDGTQAAQRFYRRRHDAEQLAVRLRDRGFAPVVFVSDTKWREVR